jgi:AcrR family transcriptional regulator
VPVSALVRPLAKAVGSSPRVLLYYVGSKEELVVKTLARLRDRQHLDRAVDLWLHALEAIPLAKESTHGG